MGQKTVIIFHTRRGGGRSGNVRVECDMDPTREQLSRARIDVLVGPTIQVLKRFVSAFVLLRGTSSHATEVHEMVNKVTH